MKDQKKEKSKLTKSSLWRAVILTAVLTTAINEITGGLISSAWRFAKTTVWPAKLEISVTECMIYRTSFDEFPTCEMNIMAHNPSHTDMGIELRSLRLFRENILYHFPAGREILRVPAEDRLVRHVAFRDKVLDEALRVPQDSATAIIELTYEYVHNKSQGRMVVDDAEVIKCTYWQVPTFDTEAQALATGAEAFWLEPTAWWTDSAGASRCTTMKFTTFTTKTGLHDFDLTGLKNLTIDRSSKDFARWRLPVPFLISSVFRRRYGGVYSGHLIRDSVEITPFRYANEFLAQSGDYDQYSLIGTTCEKDFREILEFIHYTFDPTKQDEAFRLRQDNSKFYVLLIHEDPKGISAIADSLKGWGYRAGCVKTQGPGGFLAPLALMPPDEKLPALADTLNSCLDSLNFVIHNNEVFLFLPVILDTPAVARIAADLRRASGKSVVLAFSFDCRPFRSHLVAAAPFSTPVLAVLNFAPETSDIMIDTMGMGLLTSPR